MVTIKEINTPDEIKQFVMFPWRIYANDPNWVPPLIGEQRAFFNPEKNPYYRHSKVLLLMAYRGNEPVGRLSVHENTLHVKKYNEKVGFFGFFECIDDFEVAKALFDYAKIWLKKLGYEKMRGPANFSVNGEYSLLVKGFDSPPAIMMTYNPPYYETLLTQYGFQTSQEMYAYQMYTEAGLPEDVLKRAAEAERKHPEFIVRKMSKLHLDRETKIVQEIYNEAWNENWGAIWFSDEEIKALAKQLVLIIDEDIAFIGEVNGKPIGFSLSIPDANQALRVANGRLFPWGLMKMLWAKRHIKNVRVLVMGVLKAYRHQGLDTVFYKKTYEEGLKKGYHAAEGSLVNESNTPMRRVLEKLGAKIYKTYRMYDLTF
ncbi:MAG: GNAT family N-acetyltransferase [Patescibacteria group bacterium]|nr:GNAT family N-acetyltransferase [Patescibacteria group bacterium]MDD5715930.1 GNAT family N-acetyltransferase [Patescibacteria group bacterium]